MKFEFEISAKSMNRSMSSLQISKQGTVEKYIREEMKYKSKGKKKARSVDSVFS